MGSKKINLLHKGKAFSISVKEYNQESSKKIVFLHGANIGAVQWEKIVKEFDEYHIIAIDAISSGNSSMLSYDDLIPEIHFIEFTEKVIQELIGNDPVYIVGHSIGAWVAVNLYMRRELNVSALVLESPFGLSRYVPLRYKPISNYFICKFVTKFPEKPNKKNLKNFLLDGFHDKSIDVDFIVNKYIESVNRDIITHPLKLMSILMKWGKIKEQYYIGDLLNQIDIPVLIMHGKEDTLLDKKNIGRYENVASINEIVYTDCGHVPSLEKQKHYIEKIKSHLEL